MKRQDGQGGGNVKRVLDENRDELMWLAEVMTGSRLAGEQCLAEAIELADAARYIGNEWMLSWIKRLLVHVALKRMSGEIRELLPTGNAPIAASHSGVEAGIRDGQKLRSIPPQRLVASLDVVERACLVLHVYLGYSVLDCALLLGSPRVWIEPICDRVLRKIIAGDQSSHGECPRFHSFVSLRVMECAG